MADPVRKLLKKIKGIPVKPLPPPEPIWKRLEAERKYDNMLTDGWERDKKHNRTLAFEKAQIKLREYQEARRAQKEAEELRQLEIEKTRLKNLRKARRTLQKMREEQ